ncbi:MAG: CHAT domain-containing protein [Synechococcales bacterium]|nr:CHAT domain-containing protein [Synechococcales bacterium]
MAPLVLCLWLFLGAAALPTAAHALLASLPTAQNPSQALRWEQQGRELYQAGRFAEAIATWQQALPALTNPMQQATILSNLALAYQQLGQLRDADGAIQAAIARLEGSTGEGRSPVLAQVLDVQGHLQLARGQGDAALASWQQAFEIYEQVGHSLAAPTWRLRNQINQAQALRSLGLYRRAYDQLTHIQQELQDLPDSLVKAAGLRNLGNVLRVTGDLAISRQLLEQSLAIAQSLADPNAVTETLLSLGNTASEQQDTAAALAYYDQVVAIAPPSITLVSAQLQRLKLWLDQRQGDALQRHLPSLLTQMAALPPSRRTVYLRIDLARTFLRLPTAASGAEVPPLISRAQLADLLAIAVQQAQTLQDPRAEADALGTLGQVYEHNRQWIEAKELTRQALLLSQATQASDLAYQWQWQMGRLLAQEGDFSGAIAAYEAAIAALQSLRYDLVGVNPDIQFSFRDEVEPVYRQLVELLLHSEGTTLSQPRLERARWVIESLQIAELNNFLREACLDATQVLDQVIEQQDPTAAVIYPIILPRQLTVILTLPQQPLQAFTIAVDQKTVQQTLDQLRQELVKPQRHRQAQAISQQIYDWLIRPAEESLAQADIDTLVFVLDGELRNIPMAALYDGDRYLIETYSLALTPGLQLIGPKPLQEVELSVIAAGVSEPRSGFSALPHVPLELQTIQSQLPGQTLLNDEFTRAALQTQVQQRPFPVVHLATHGQFSSQASETFIVAWDERIYVDDVQQVLQTRTDAQAGAIELLVLSACQTAAGDRRAVLGLAGVAIRAGARSTLASLWNVNDASTAQLMSAFYQALQTGLPKAEALRQAQLQLLHDQRYWRPLYWSPYVLIGNWL